MTWTWLVVYLPLWKIWVRPLGWWHSQYTWYGKKQKHVPDHQPANIAIWVNHNLTICHWPELRGMIPLTFTIIYGEVVGWGRYNLPRPMVDFLDMIVDISGYREGCPTSGQPISNFQNSAEKMWTVVKRNNWLSEILGCLPKNESSEFRKPNQPMLIFHTWVSL